jgi:hypothetical protein
MKEFNPIDITLKSDTTEETDSSGRTFSGNFYGDSYVELEEAALAAADEVFPDLPLAVYKDYRVTSGLGLEFSNPANKKFMADITVYVIEDVEPEEEMRSLGGQFFGDNDVEIENAAWNAAAEVFPGCLLHVVRDYSVASASQNSSINPENKKWCAAITVRVVQDKEPIAE